jgi:hypothetical protein
VRVEASDDGGPHPEERSRHPGGRLVWNQHTLESGPSSQLTRC